MPTGARLPRPCPVAAERPFWLTRSTPRALEILRVFLIARLLSDDTLDFSAWQDDRNDFTFDLRMVDQTSGRQVSYERRKGSASGAERQVPYYVIIGLQIVIAAPSELSLIHI